LEFLVKSLVPCLLFEDEHLLVINKPAGLNTHSPAPFAGEGLYDWLRHREPRWADLAIIQRLDKETSGVIVFSKTTLANRSLTEQFTQRAIHKRYLLLTDRSVKSRQFTAVSTLVRAGEKYLSRPLHSGAERAETGFRVIRAAEGRTWIEAEPVTGRTHQIRVHAAEHGFPILGDVLYGGTPGERLCLHAQRIVLRHPATGAELKFEAEVDFTADPRCKLRAALIDPNETNAYRWIHGAADGWPGCHVDRLGDFLLSQSAKPLSEAQLKWLEQALTMSSLRGVYHKMLNRRASQATVEQSSPQKILGESAPDKFVIQENGLRFELSFQEGYSVGLFLDQRENRRRFLTGHVAAGFPLYAQHSPRPEVLNAFAYTCGFSVCAAKGGARVTSLDLSRKYLEWGKRNFGLNDLEVEAHDFIYGDAFDWFRRLAKKDRQFDIIALDPPTFSRSKTGGAFRVESDYGKLVGLALPLLRPGGVLFASTNTASLPPDRFLEMVSAPIQSAGRTIARQHYQPQPPDFPVSREEPAYLKTIWLKLETP
jgi:23S rRNA (cytosine1962-C5)-methyltransferase